MKLVYFAWLRERLGIQEENVDLPSDVTTVANLFDWLKERDELFADVFEHEAIIQVAINKKHEQNRAASITDASEIALFPPMTGG
ncbi:MAG: molybdopterin converting factor subunit 1 [Pseudomonadota bacterium]